jgi:hypothetical protein
MCAKDASRLRGLATEGNLLLHRQRLELPALVRLQPSLDGGLHCCFVDSHRLLKRHGAKMQQAAALISFAECSAACAAGSLASFPTRSSGRLSDLVQDCEPARDPNRSFRWQPPVCALQNHGRRYGPLSAARAAFAGRKPTAERVIRSHGRWHDESLLGLLRRRLAQLHPTNRRPRRAAATNAERSRT